eukprot:Nitzschia sp. Nitz4//scaffold111_size72815//64721//65225//NITZ4_005800-RA/size72815-snap-gene-0.112-mRNA-1//-1//CDS//3329533210//3291//frame0
MVLSSLEAIVMMIFANCETLSNALIAMVVFAILGQMAMGTCLGVMPYVDGPNTGTIAGIVGAGGNVGAVFFLYLVQLYGDTAALQPMAISALLASFLTPLIVIKGYRGLIFGEERSKSEVSSVTLLVPKGEPTA